MKALFAFLLLGAAGSQAAWQLEPAAPLQTPRAVHQAVLLNDGRLLLIGGCAEASCEGLQRSAEWFDAASGRTRAAGNMNEPRVSHTAEALADGRVLVVGGWTGRSASASGELFEPATGRFRLLQRGLSGPRMDVTLTRLADGSLLVAGGAQALNQPVNQVERFDPKTERFVPLGRLHEARTLHTATRLADGRVLMVGGLRARHQASASAELFDPRTGTSIPTGALQHARCKHAAVALQDGRVLVIGGSPDCNARLRRADSEIYDPATGRFTPGPTLKHARYKIAGSALLLPDGAVLVAGDAPEAEVWTPGEAAFRPLPTPLGAALAFTLATALPGGEVFISGGYDERTLPTDRTWRLRRSDASR
jgi:Galactose oxidase, central domain